MRFDRRNAEEGGVELVDVIDEGAETAGVVLHLSVWEERAHATDARAWGPFCHGVLTGFEQTPEGRDIRRVGKSTRHTYDRYWLV